MLVNSGSAHCGESDQFEGGGNRLAAKLHIADETFSNLFLGVPEDKKTAPPFSISTLDSINLEIRERPAIPYGENEPREPEILGALIYFEADEYNDELVFSRFDVSKTLFDYIEKMVNQPNSTLTATLKMKCWHWLGPIGDSQIYLAKERKGFPVYLTKLMTDTRMPTISQLDHDAKVPDVTLATVVDRIAALQAQATSIKTSTRIIAVVVGLLALIAMLR